MTPAEWGLIIAALSVTAYFLGKFATLRSIGIFLGVALIGINGHVIAFLDRVLALVARFTGVIGAWAFGASGETILIVVVLVLGFVMVHDWLPKNAAKKRTFWISLVMGILVAASATGIGALNGLPGEIQSGITQTTSGSGLTSTGG